MNRLIIIITCLMLGNTLQAQWECPSQLGGSLKPVGNSPLMWGTEITTGVGSLYNNWIFNTMGLIGLDLTIHHTSLYAEGGVKYWLRQDNDLNTQFSNYRFGLREFYLQQKSDNFKLTLGLQSLKSEDDYLVNERVLGVNYLQTISRFSINLYGGTVSKDFARNGTFCNMEYLYDILPYKNRTLLGNNPGQTNLAGLTLAYHPGTGKTSGESSEDGLNPVTDFQNDGLGSSDKEQSKFLKVETIGLIAYSEFGSWITDPHKMYGLYSKLELGNGFYFRPEVLHQLNEGNQALIYTLKFEKSFDFGSSQRLSFSAAGYGLKALDKGASADNLFSNIFAGTVLRLDAPDLPFYQGALKYSLPHSKFHIKAQYTSQSGTDPSSEADLEIGKKFFNRLLINGTYGYIKSPLMADKPNLYRMELRFNF